MSQQVNDWVEREMVANSEKDKMSPHSSHTSQHTLTFRKNQWEKTNSSNTLSRRPLKFSVIGHECYRHVGIWGSVAVIVLHTDSPKSKFCQLLQWKWKSKSIFSRIHACTIRNQWEASKFPVFQTFSLSLVPAAYIFLLPSTSSFFSVIRIANRGFAT